MGIYNLFASGVGEGGVYYLTDPHHCNKIAFLHWEDSHQLAIISVCSVIDECSINRSEHKVSPAIREHLVMIHRLV